ncbi:MAG: AMIN domain-containing protein [Gemmatimonadaceae bacterium]|nr:AMIN domain-containing protein [Gemmatimonadaceae bacterium]
MMGPTTVAVMTAALAHAALGSATFGASTVREAVPAGSTAYSAAPAISHDDPAPANGRVSRISVGPGTGGAEIAITLDSSVTVRHFTLDGPARLVVDLGGASLTVRGAAYDGQARGPIRNVRLSQYRSDTVRMVIDLDATRQYSVDRSGGKLRVSVTGPAVAIAQWETRAVGGESTTHVAAGRLDAPAPTFALPVVTSDSSRPKVSVPSLAEQARGEAVTLDVTRAEKSRAEAVKAEVARKELKAIADAPMVGRAGAAGRTGTQQSQQQQKARITVSYDGIDIRDVIAAFAAFSTRTIVVGKEVSGMVTADINDKPWDVALQAILQAQGLAATEDASGIITVDSYRNLASNQALEPMETRIINVNYAKAAVLEKTVQSLLARDCTGLSTMATGRELGMPMNQGSSGGGQGGNQLSGQGCVVRGNVASDSATNKLIITEVPSRLPEIVSRLQELDIRTQQVAIKAKIIFVNRTGIQDIGLAYDLGTGTKQFFQQLVPRTDPSTLTGIDTDGDGVPDATGGGTPFQGPARIALGGNAISGIANANNAIKPNALNLIYSTALGRYQLTAFINALQTSSLADVQSEPSVTILNNRTAQIFVGQEIPIRVIDASSGGGAQGGGGGGGGGAQGSPNAAAFFPRATVSKEEAGIKLTVSPQITNNKMVLLDIQAENSSAEISNTDVGVIFNRQRADSKVLVADGEAAVIGGLTVTETTRFRSGIPVLMNLPFIGRLFSQNSKNETKRDLLILVTPHILEDGAVPPPGR